MNAVVINVSPMTRQMMLSNYGNEPIQLYAKSDIYDLLHIMPHSDSANEAAATLTATIMVLVNKTIEKRLMTKAGRVVGMALHRYYIRKQNEFIEWSVASGAEAKASLESFREVHAIDEDHYALESAYRSWSRYNRLKKNYSILVKEKRYFVPRKINQALAPISPQKVIESVASIYGIGKEDIFKRRNCNEPKKVLAYVLSKEGGMTLKQIAVHLRQRNLTRIAESIECIDFLKQKDSTLKQRVDSCINLL